MNALPIYKVGLVLLRQADSASPQVLLVRPKPKNPGETAPLVLPRGSRAYRAADGSLQDVRDATTALKHRDQLELLEETLLREAHEEAGIPPQLLQAALARGAVRALGARSYKDYQVYWYVVTADETFCAAMLPPMDALEVTWASVEQLAALGVPEGYQRVIREVVES